MNIYNNLVKDSGGGCPLNKILFIYDNYIKNQNINKIVEIGVYNGCFLLPIAEFSNVECIGIDPYTIYIQNDIIDSKIYNIAKTITTDQKLLDNIYDRLLNNISKFNIKNVQIKKNKSNEVYTEFIDESIDILHIDGNHDYNSVLDDLINYNTKIKKNGILIMDDTNWTPVMNAMLKFLNINNNYKILHKFDEWMILQKN